MGSNTTADVFMYIFASIVAVLHVYFMVLEMFLWQTEGTLKRFRMTAEKAEATASLAKNQGLYNGFLAAGLVWGMTAAPTERYERIVFFLACVVVAGLYGAVTASRGILYFQAMPAIIALVITAVAWSMSS